MGLTTNILMGQRAPTTITGGQVSSLAARLRQLAGVCTAVAVLAVPLASATIQESGNLLFVSLSVLMGVSWAMAHILDPRPGVSTGVPGVVAIAAISLVCLQLVPLSPGLVSKLLPWATQNLKVDSGGLAFSEWTQISLAPSLTQSGLVLTVGYCVFALTLIQQLNSVKDVDRLIKLVAVSAVGMAVLGLAQLFYGNGQFLWMFDHPFRSAEWPAKGAFSNPNHFAQFLALGIGPLLLCWADSQKKVKEFGRRRQGPGQPGVIRYATACAIPLVLVAGLLSFSRGGLAALCIATVIGFIAVRKHVRTSVRFLAPAAGFVVLAGVFFGLDHLQSKLNVLAEAETSSEFLQARYVLWSALKDAIPNFWLTGAGLGSHAEIYPTWITVEQGVRFSHAESGYLQVLLELGLPGLILLVIGIVYIARCSYVSIRNRKTRNRAIALTAGLTASVLHSAVDFVWYIPGCMILTLTVTAMLIRLRHESVSQDTEQKQRTSPATGLMAWVIILLAFPAGQLVADVGLRDAGSEADWNLYRRDAIKAMESGSLTSMTTLDDNLDQIIGHLERCRTRDPQDYRASADLAAMYLRRFEREQKHSDNPMSLWEVRNTVHSAEFSSPRELAEWLNRALGPHAADLYRALKMCQHSLHGQPMRGESWLILSQIGFLVGITEEQEKNLLEQAIRLRPHRGVILYAAGLGSMEQGHFDEAMDWWKQAFRKDPAVRPVIVKGLAPYLTGRELIEHLDPGTDGLFLMYRELKKLNRESECRVISHWFEEHFDEIAAGSELTALFWRSSHELFNFNGNSDQAIYCLEQAWQQAPNDFEIRRQLGLKLLQAGRSKEAVRHIKWCLGRRPTDPELLSAGQSSGIELPEEEL